MSHSRYVGLLAGLFALLWLALAIEPSHRQDWLLENVLVAIGIGLLVATYRKLPLSKASYTLLFIYLSLHAIGAHYTYAEVPYDAWFESLTGTTFNELVGWERNNFDRLVHFSYGLLLAYPVRELFLRIASFRGFWGYFLPLDLTMSTSMLYELIEWGAAAIFGGELGAAYLGTQGDIWDAHKDMALASLGALITMCATALVNVHARKDYALDWVMSVGVTSNVARSEVS